MNEQYEQYRKAIMQFVDKIRTVLANMTKEIFRRVYDTLKQMQCILAEPQSDYHGTGRASRYWRRYWAVALGLCKERACKKKRRLRRGRRKP